MKHLIIFVFLSLFSIAVPAQVPWREAIEKINYKDSTTIPPFCRINNPDPRYKNTDWKKKFGEDFIYINHYCAAKAVQPVCFQYPKKEKNECNAGMIESTTYAIQHSKDPNYQLLPFLHTERGETLIEMGRYPEAIQSFYSAIQKNKKYIRAYAMLADTYILTKQYDEAEKVINEGLKYKESSALSKRLEKIKALKK